MSDKPRYTEGIVHDGAGILKDGVLMTIDEILKELNANVEPKYKYQKYMDYCDELIFNAGRELK